MEISPNNVSRKDFYKMMTGVIVPRPIAWVSTINESGQPNLAPFSFFNAVCSKPPTLLFCPLVRGTDGNNKDTVKNIQETGEFVVNIVTAKLAEAMNITAQELPSTINEFELANLNAVPSKTVTPPRVAESPVNIECKMTQIITIGDGGSGSGNIIIGEILHMHVNDDVMLPNYKINSKKLNPIGRLAGPNYTYINDMFELIRPPSEINKS